MCACYMCVCMYTYKCIKYRVNNERRGPEI